LFAPPRTADEWARYRLSGEQIDFYRAKGYVAGVRVLTGEQVEVLRRELSALVDPAHPRHHLFYEFHSNESADPATTLFHALGAWRIAAGFHDLLWNPAFTVPASQRATTLVCITSPAATSGPTCRSQGSPATWRRFNRC